MGKKRSAEETKAAAGAPSKFAKHDLIIDQLHNQTTAFEALKTISENEGISDLLSQGGTGKELLEVVDNSVEKLKSSEISIVFNACEAFLLHITKAISNASTEEESSSFRKLGIDLTREILEDHIGYVILLLSGSNTAYQVKSSLRLLTSMVTCCGQTAREVLNKVDLEHKNWESVSKRQSAEIRQAFIQFLLSFFIVGHSGVAKDFMEKKNLLASILPGLIKDESELVQLVLIGFKEKILENSTLSKTAKMKLFSVNNLKHILSLFEWKGPQSDQESTEDFLQAKETVVEAAQEFLVTAITSTKSGLVFHDPSYGTSGSNQNMLLFNFLNSIHEPWLKPSLAKVVIAALGACPDQIRPYIMKMLQPIWAPRHSDAWLMVVDFLYAILESLDMAKVVHELASKNKLTTTVVSNFCCNEKVFKEVIKECVTVDDHLIKMKGLELEALLLNKLEIVLNHKQVSPSSKKQILFRLQDRLPSFECVQKAWHAEIGTRVIDIEDGMEDNSPNYLLAVTQVLSFYLSHFPEKYSSSDLDIEAMLLKIGQGKKDQDWMVQLHLLKHLITSHQGISSNKDYLNTLVNIACVNFNDDNGNLALDALFGLLSKRDLCYQKIEMQVWFAFVKGGKVPKLLTEAIINLLQRKEIVFDEVRAEIGQVGDLSSSSSAPSLNFGVDKLMTKLQDPDMQIEENNQCTTEMNKMSPFLWELMRCKALMHHQAYFEKCMMASFFVQEDPTFMLHIMKRQDFHSFPALGNDALISCDTPECPNQEFQKTLEKSHLISKLKMGLAFKEDVIEETDFEWILRDRQLLVKFDPSRCSDLNKLLCQVFAWVPVNQLELLQPFSERVIRAIKSSDLETSEQVEQLLKILPMKTDDLIETLEELCAKPYKKCLMELICVTLRKLCQTDKWSFARLSPNVLKRVTEMLEKTLTDDLAMAKGIMPEIVYLVKINIEFCNLMTNTHLSLACNAGFSDLVDTLFDYQKEQQNNFRKWISNNIDQVGKFESIVVKLIESGNCKTKFINTLFNGIKSGNHIKILAVMVEKYDQDLSEIIEILPPCEALLLHCQKKGKQEDIISRFIVPLMKSVSKLVKDPNAVSMLESQSDLLQKGLKDVNLYGNNEFQEMWPTFIKATLKHGLKPNKSSSSIKALGDLFEQVIHSGEKSNCGETYSLICGHSQFVPILFSQGDKKVQLLSLILTLIKADPKVCSSVQVPIYLGAYNATLDKADKLILEILQWHESKGSVSFQAFKPLIWGQAAISKFSVMSSSKSNNRINKSLKVSEVLALIQPEKMIQSALKMPNTFEVDDSDHYDPRFFLPLLCQLCSPENFVDKHLKLVESGGLALAFASLSCRDKEVRQLGLVTLHRIYIQLEKARKSLSAEKQVWLHLVDIVRNGLINVLDEFPPPRIPHLTTAFLVKATKILAHPMDPMFKSISNFILAKPMMDLFSMPEFLRLFHSSDVAIHQLEQEWIIGVIKDGVKDELDYSILQQNFILKMIMSFYSSSLGNDAKKDLVLDIIEAISKLNNPALDMIRNHGLLLWLQTIENENRRKLISILSFLSKSTQGRRRKQTSLELATLVMKLMKRSADKDSHAEDVIALLQVLGDIMNEVDPIEHELLIDVSILQEKAASLSSQAVDAIIIHYIRSSPKRLLTRIDS